MVLEDVQNAVTEESEMIQIGLDDATLTAN